ncbi:MAG: hypothetical protein GQ467_02305 [Mariprofundaceae bacterium]|nr:hypothetical protein [Mariprofundaceae bacterium]
MGNSKKAFILLMLVAVSLSACAAGKKDTAIELSNVATGQLNLNGTCVATRQWGDYQFSARLSQGEKGALDVSVDMSETPWPVGVIDTWLEMGNRKILPSETSEGAVAAHKSSTWADPAVGAVGAAAGGIGALGAVLSESKASKRRKLFDPSTARWTGVFHPGTTVDCNAKLAVRFWTPREGVKGLRAINVRHCFCGPE